MSDHDRARRQLYLGLIVAAVIAPLAALCAALAAAIGARLVEDARNRLGAAETLPRRPDSPVRLATPRPAGRTDHRRPRRAPTRHTGRILH
ncbi:hypothetical protein [Nocardia sp. NPDC005978]|uniref:hypothetical protein n=1 Tax=unclassified Nocardia TaxID=2637762 RepID=UPI0033AD20F0